MLNFLGKSVPRISIGVFLGLLVCVLVFSSPLWAQKAATVTCVGCHEKVPATLPALHKSFNMSDTAKCFLCHVSGGKAKLLGDKIHVTHAKKNPDMMADCSACHVTAADGAVKFSGAGVEANKETMQSFQGKFSSWMTSKYLDNQHFQKGLGCLACHQSVADASKAKDTQAQCVKCHGDLTAMIKKTEKTSYEHNPHETHLTDVKCSDCHGGHKAFTDHCGGCHSFDYKAPGSNGKKAGAK